MSCWSYKVKTAVYSCVHNVTSIEPRLILKITLKLVIHIIQNWLETKKKNCQSLNILQFQENPTKVKYLIYKIICLQLNLH